jgi:ABC-2 type transport system ATP-binding protein
VISLEGASARRKPVSIKNVDLEWGPGLHAVVGTFGDGCALLLAVLVGAAPLARGRVRVLGRPPTDPESRTQIARVGIEPSLPDALRVDEALDLASRVRGDAPRGAVGRLALLGIEALAPRPVRSLSRGEARGVAMVEALTSARVRVLVVEEPFASSDTRVAGRIVEGFREKSQSGCAIVFTTSSLRDASDLADDYVLLSAGRLLGAPTPVRALAGVSLGTAYTVIVARDGAEARQIAAALSAQPGVAGFELDANTVRLRGGDPVALARAAGRAVTEANVSIVEIRSESPSLDDARTAAVSVAAS